MFTYNENDKNYDGDLKSWGSSFAQLPGGGPFELLDFVFRPLWAPNPSGMSSGSLKMFRKVSWSDILSEALEKSRRCGADFWSQAGFTYSNSWVTGMMTKRITRIAMMVIVNIMRP